MFCGLKLILKLMTSQKEDNLIKTNQIESKSCKISVKTIAYVEVVQDSGLSEDDLDPKSSKVVKKLRI